MLRTVLCADIGTSSLKAALIGSDGEVFAHSRQMFISRFTDHSANEWISAFKQAVHEIYGQISAGQAEQPKVTDIPVPSALCISGNGPTLVSENGETLLWSVTAQSDKESYVCPEEAQSLFIPRIKLFKQKYQNAWSSASVILSGPEFLIYKLTGKAFTILPEKRFEKAYWSDEVLEKAGFSSEEINRLPPFAAPGTLAGTLNGSAVSFIGLSDFIPEGIPVYLGAPDFVSALVGTDTLQPGRLCDRAGSSEGLNLCTAVPLDTAPSYTKNKIRVLPSVVQNLWNASCLLPDSGSRFSDFKMKVEREIGVEIDFTALVKRCMVNETNSPTFEQGKYLMLQTALNIRDGLQILLGTAYKQQNIMVEEMVVTGGQAANDDWNQIKANVTGLRICVPHFTDAELIGDAVFAFTGMGVFKNIQDGAKSLHRIAKKFEPQDIV